MKGLDQFVAGVREQIEDFWFCDNPNGTDVNEEIEKMLKIIEIQSAALQWIGSGNLAIEKRNDKEFLQIMIEDVLIPKAREAIQEVEAIVSK